MTADIKLTAEAWGLPVATHPAECKAFAEDLNERLTSLLSWHSIGLQPVGAVLTTMRGIFARGARLGCSNEAMRAALFEVLETALGTCRTDLVAMWAADDDRFVDGAAADGRRDPFDYDIEDLLTLVCASRDLTIKQLFAAGFPEHGYIAVNGREFWPGLTVLDWQRTWPGPSREAEAERMRLLDMDGPSGEVH